MSANALVVFAKQPVAGRVKTRMCPPLELAQAAALYGHMLADVLEESVRACDRSGARLFLAVHPPESVPSMREVAGGRAEVFAQRGDDLAGRMHAALERLAGRGFDRLAIRGSDSPALSADRIEEAFQSLDAADLAICRDADGGYALLAVREPHPALFDHPMSTASVADDTLRNARALGWRCRELAPGFDLDTVEDLARLRSIPRRLTDTLCPRTVRLLDERGWWPD